LQCFEDELLHLMHGCGYITWMGCISLCKNMLNLNLLSTTSCRAGTR